MGLLVTLTIFFTSDNHFNHKNVLHYCGRPFKDVSEMNSTMIARWNLVVQSDDLVYHLGDFAFGNKEIISNIRRQLNGKIIIIRGNHDRHPRQMLEAGFDKVHDNLTVTVDDKVIYMNHIPVTVSDPQYTRKYQKVLIANPPEYYNYFLCGHVHEHWKRKGKVINVGVDQWNFTPRTLTELLVSE